MKRAIGVVCLVLSISIFGLGFVLPDFSGSWIRDTERIDPMSTLSDILVVRQSDASLDVESIWSQNPATQANGQSSEVITPFGNIVRPNAKRETRATYLLDGNEHSISDENGNSRTYRVTQSESQLVLERYSKTNTPFGPAEINVKEEWSLSPDGRTLIITATTKSALGTQTQKLIYTRQL